MDAPPPVLDWAGERGASGDRGASTGTWSPTQSVGLLQHITHKSQHAGVAFDLHQGHRIKPPASMTSHSKGGSR